MCVHSAHYIGHRWQLHHIVDTERRCHIRQNERLCFHAPRISDHRNDRRPDNSLCRYGRLR